MVKCYSRVDSLWYYMGPS